MQILQLLRPPAYRSMPCRTCLDEARQRERAAAEHAAAAAEQAQEGARAADARMAAAAHQAQCAAGMQAAAVAQAASDRERAADERAAAAAQQACASDEAERTAACAAQTRAAEAERRCQEATAAVAALQGQLHAMQQQLQASSPASVHASRGPSGGLLRATGTETLLKLQSCIQKHKGTHRPSQRHQNRICYDAGQERVEAAERRLTEQRALAVKRDAAEARADALQEAADNAARKHGDVLDGLKGNASLYPKRLLLHIEPSGACYANYY